LGPSVLDVHSAGEDWSQRLCKLRCADGLAAAKRDDRSVFLRLEELPSNILTDRARKSGVPRRDLAAKLLNIVLQQGPTFIDNLLDDED
jgi:hypothetical protein